MTVFTGIIRNIFQETKCTFRMKNCELYGTRLYRIMPNICKKIKKSQHLVTMRQQL